MSLLTRQTAVVTGGSKGMGLAIAQTLAADGASVAVIRYVPTVSPAARLYVAVTPSPSWARSTSSWWNRTVAGAADSALLDAQVRTRVPTPSPRARGGDVTRARARRAARRRAGNRAAGSVAARHADVLVDLA